MARRYPCTYQAGAFHIAPAFLPDADEHHNSGDTVTVTVTRARSVQEHRRFFGPVLATIWDNLPEGHPYTSKEHLRARLLVDAGHYYSQEISIDNMDINALRTVTGAVIKLLKENGKEFVFVEKHDGKLIFKAAKSMAFDLLPDNSKSHKLMETVATLGSVMIGVDVNTLLAASKER